MNTPDAADRILSIRNLTKNFGALQVLRGVDLHVKRGEVVFLIGPSGSGKSTLLRCINFLERPNAGSISFNGKSYCGNEGGRFSIVQDRDIRQLRTHVPIVFQHFNLFKHMTVLENVIEGPVHVLKEPKSRAIEHAKEILASVGLGEKFDAYPAQLSGGQQQRVGIARACDEAQHDPVRRADLGARPGARLGHPRNHPEARRHRHDHGDRDA